VRRAAALLVLTVVSAGGARAAQAPAGDSAAVADARAAAERWLALVDSGRYAASWDSAAVAFRRAVTQPQWVDGVQRARAPLDPLGARRFATGHFARDLPNAPPGEYVVLTYQTAAARGATVIETVVPMKDPDGRWRVSGYFVRPA
jgi:hypothetical protein